MAEKNYVGKGKKIGQYGAVKIGFKLDAVKANEKGYVNLIVQPLKEIDKYSNTHTVYVDDYVPPARSNADQNVATAEQW